MRRAALAAMLALVASSGAPGEIERNAHACDTGLCVSWWPKLVPPAGWTQDVAVSRADGILALAPDGKSFDTADRVIYAAAIPKGGSDLRSLAEFIAFDQRQFEQRAPEAIVLEVAPVATADGRKLRSFTYFPRADGKWERVCFGEEGDYFFVITLSAGSQAAYEAALPAYVAMLGRYGRAGT